MSFTLTTLPNVPSPSVAMILSVMIKNENDIILLNYIYIFFISKIYGVLITINLSEIWHV